jgi:hypothetical protein
MVMSAHGLACVPVCRAAIHGADSVCLTLRFGIQITASLTPGWWQPDRDLRGETAGRTVLFPVAFIRTPSFAGILG